ncbi:hypothetical protein MKX01_014183 [Papaver californicum]|nr:hypothetical protein MKX01_014183 [Papaver californicum]
MSSRKQLEVRSEDRIPPKWSVDNFISKGNPIVSRVFGVGSLFSPLLFGKFFDPYDIFHLWEFDSDVLLSSLYESHQSTVDWSKTDKEYVVEAELPGKFASIGYISRSDLILIRNKRTNTSINMYYNTNSSLHLRP